jgi:tetratricopeptide (TPR) repeat protein
VSLLAVLPLILHMRGAPWGVPVADDFDYLHRVMFSGKHTLFDGCGSIFYWRPLSRQIYFEALGGAILSVPALVAWLHVALLALTAAILYRALRVTWPGPAACVAATFPLLAESTRMLITWPSNFQDLGAMLFAALAVHAAAHRRLALALAALALSLFSKEVGVLAALLLPWMPQKGGMPLRERIRWAAWTGALVAAWAAAYVAVSRAAGLVLPSQIEQDPAALATPLVERVGWALWNSARSAFSLPSIEVPGESAIWIALAGVLLAALFMLALRAASRARLRALAGWPLWGLLWFAVAGTTLLAIFPTWAAYRGLFAVVGLGIALVAIVGAAHPLLLFALVALRLVAFAASPGPPAAISSLALVTGAQIDYPNLVRLQRLVTETRGLLRSEFPALPAGSGVGQHHLPLLSEWAFVGSKALQTWYGDSTLHWVRFEDFRADTTIALATIVEFKESNPFLTPGKTTTASPNLIDPAAMRALIAAEAAIRAEDWAGTIAALDRAEALQSDRDAGLFLGTVAAKKALAFAGTGDPVAAEREARRGLEFWASNPDSRYVLAYLWEKEGRYAEAESQLDTLLTLYPRDADAAALMERVRAARIGSAP